MSRLAAAALLVVSPLLPQQGADIVLRRGGSPSTPSVEVLSSEVQTHPIGLQCEGWSRRRLVFPRHGAVMRGETVDAEQAGEAALHDFAALILDGKGAAHVRLVRKRIDADGALLDYAQYVPAGPARTLAPVHGGYVRVVLDPEGRPRAIITDLALVPDALDRGPADFPTLEGRLDSLFPPGSILGDDRGGVDTGLLRQASPARADRAAVGSPVLGAPEVFVAPSGTIHVACPVDVVTGAAKVPTLRLIVDVADGRILDRHRLSLDSGGIGTSFTWNWCQTPAFQSALHFLDGSGFLRGPFADVYADYSIGLRAQSSSLDFRYRLDDPAAFPGVLGQTAAYEHAVFNALGFEAIGHGDWAPQLRITDQWFWDPCGYGSCYLIQQNVVAIALFTSGYLPSDIDTWNHEMAHAIQDSLGFPVSASGSNATVMADSFAEGQADFYAALMRCSCPPQTVDSSTWDFMDSSYCWLVRSCVNSFHYPMNYVATRVDTHENGRILSGFLRDSTLRFGRANGWELAPYAFRYMSAGGTDTFDDIFEAFILADADLHQGAFDSMLRQHAWWRGLHGYASTSPYPSTGFPESQHPYPDSGSALQTFQIPGASALRVLFDPLTRASWSSSSAHDTIGVTDGSGQHVPGSPFWGEQLQGVALDVPGDTVRLQISSTPNDARSSFGYRILSITSIDPNNLPPSPSLAFSVSSGMVPLAVEFDAGGSTDPDGAPMVFKIDPGDGSDPIFLDPTVRKARHVYNLDRCDRIALQTQLTVTLTVTDDKGATASTQRTIGLSPYVPVARYEAFGQGCAGGNTSTIGFGANLDQPLVVTTPPQGSYVSFATHVPDHARTIDGIAFETQSFDPNYATITIPVMLRAWDGGSYAHSGTLLRSSNLVLHRTRGWYRAQWAPITLPADTLISIEVYTGNYVPPLAAGGLPITVPGGSAQYLRYRFTCTDRGLVPELYAVRTPSIGQTFAVHLRDAQPLSAASLCTGFSASSYGGFSPPLDLTQIGAPGCLLLVGPEVVQAQVTDAVGHGSNAFLVPSSNSIVGVELFQQWVCLDPSANALSVVLSNGGHARIGPR